MLSEVRTLKPHLNNLSINVNVKTKIAKRLAVQIMNQDMIHETKKFSADDGKQLETGNQ